MAKDHRLTKLAETFVVAFKAALIDSEERFRAVLQGTGAGFSTGAHGTVEFTNDLVEASRDLSSRAVKVFGAGRIHQKSVEEVARSVAFTSDDTDSVKDIAAAVAAAICEAATKQYRVIYPNQLFRFMDDVREVKVGPVRLITREQIAQEVETHSSTVSVAPTQSSVGPFAILHNGGCAGATVHLPSLCWDVAVQGMPKGLELQALWYIDVSISFIRLHYRERRGMFLGLADIEPHPISPQPSLSHRLLLSPEGVSFGGVAASPWYEVDAEMSGLLSSAEVSRAAEQVFNPENNSLAERMQQALGWLTRARRAQEPAERLLFFFTAIEALLSSASKDGPVTETISRYAGVIWSENAATRFALYTSLKKHYTLRSRIVHNGERAVAQIEVNSIHHIAWTITQILLQRADLSMSHKDFIDSLKRASFGTKLEI